MEKYRNQIIGVVLLLIAAVVSFTVVAPYATNPDSYEKSITSLDEKKETVLKLAAASTTTSVAITFIPGDAATPIAEKLADLSGYFLIVLCSIYLEKYLLTITGYATFKLLIPLACILLGINFFARNKSMQKLAVKLLVFGTAIFLVIPASIKVSTMIESTYAASIADTLQNADDTVNQIEDITGMTATEEPEVETETQEAEQKEESIWDKAQSFFGNAADKTQEAVSGVAGAIGDAVGSISSAMSGELVEKAEKVLNHFLEAVAVMIITSCVIPILVLIFFVWIIKMTLELDINLPTTISMNRFKH